MKLNRTYFLLLITGLLFLSACTGSRALNASSWPGVLATEDRVYVANNRFVYALNAASGRLLWQFPDEADNQISFYASPALSPDGSQLIAGGYDKVIYTLNPENGLPSGWSFEGAGNRYIGGILTTADGIFASNADGNLYALDYAGNPLWDEPFQINDPIWSAPATDGTNLYISALDHLIHAVNLKTGQEVWRTDLETVSTATPTVGNGVLYAGTFGNRVFAIDARTGKTLWEFETQDWVWASPAVSGDIVIAGDISGVLYGIQASSGEEVWRFESDGGIFGGPLVIDEIIYFGTENGVVYALNGEGNTEWFYSLTGKIYSTPEFNGEFLFVATAEGDALVTALDLDGTARWPFSPEN